MRQLFPEFAAQTPRVDQPWTLWVRPQNHAPHGFVRKARFFAEQKNASKFSKLFVTRTAGAMW
jgi:hypothetical protein